MAMDLEVLSFCLSRHAISQLHITVMNGLIYDALAQLFLGRARDNVFISIVFSYHLFRSVFYM
jgi:hypothetical protein